VSELERMRISSAISTQVSGPRVSPSKRDVVPNEPSAPLDRVEFTSPDPPELVRRLIPDSYIVMAPKNEMALFDQSVGKVLGSTSDAVFFLAESTQMGQLQELGAHVFPNYEYQGELFDTPLGSSEAVSSESADLPRHLDIVNIGPAWDITRGRPEVVSAVTDSGLDLSHPQLQDTVWQNPKEIANNGLDDDGNLKVDDTHGWDFTDNDNEASVESGSHHTHVYGIVHASPGETGAAGVAPEAKGMALRVAGGKRRFSSAVMIESYLYALSQGAKSINTSYNIDGFVGDRAIEATYRQLAGDDVLLFNSAGNKGRRNPKRGVLEDIVLVASTQTSPEGVDKRSEFSNYGSGIDISAPGSNIVSTLPDGRAGAFSGTSMASPTVMGVDLLIQSAHPDWNREQRWAQIAGTADSIDSLNQSEVGELGYGRINAGRALTETLPAPTITPELSTFPNGQTMNVLMRFDKVLDSESANHADAWRITDDRGEVVQRGAPKDIRLMTNQIDFNVATMPAGSYTLVGSAEHLKDPFGQPLDGNKDGVPGDDLVVSFKRIS
jgi:subtilisin family serine protease